jgi:predicted acetyltransferase
MLQQAMHLVVPSLDRLDAYADALSRGGFWADNIRREASAREELDRIARDPAAFVASLDDRAAKGGPITLSDGSQVERLPGFRRWMWDEDDGGDDDGFCGSIGFRWQPGTSALPAYTLGHIGYIVVPWRRGRGHATRALALMLVEARREGLGWVELTTDTDNLPSQKVITNNGGTLVERFDKGPAHGGGDALRWRIDLSSRA